MFSFKDIQYPFFHLKLKGILLFFLIICTFFLIEIDGFARRSKSFHFFELMGREFIASCRKKSMYSWNAAAFICSLYGVTHEFFVAIQRNCREIGINNVRSYKSNLLHLKSFVLRTEQTNNRDSSRYINVINPYLSSL